MVYDRDDPATLTMMFAPLSLIGLGFITFYTKRQLDFIRLERFHK